MREYAILEKQGIIDTDIVIIILPAGFGSHTEFGMALGLNKKLFLCAANKEEFSIQNTLSFYELPDVIKLVGTSDENLSKIIESCKCKILKK